MKKKSEFIPLQSLKEITCLVMQEITASCDFTICCLSVLLLQRLSPIIDSSGRTPTITNGKADSHLPLRL